MIRTASLGFPRIGKNRVLKRLVESYFAGRMDEAALEQGAQEIRKAHFEQQAACGLSEIPSNDFSLYDHVLDLAQMVSAVPTVDASSPYEEYFLLARGKAPSGKTSRALEMTKWFDTNYHYLVPEIDENTRFSLRFNKVRRAFQEALHWGHRTRPVLLGPVSFLLLSKNPNPQGAAPLSRLHDLLPIYVQIFQELAEAGADWIQLDEPCLSFDLTAEQLEAYQIAYDHLSQNAPQLRVQLTTYFAEVTPHLDTLVRLPVAGLHIDCVRAPEQLKPVLERWPAERHLSLGVIDGRNIWRTDLKRLVEQLAPLVQKNPERFLLSTSCSLLHCPVDLEQESKLDPELKSWLSFAVQKLGELQVLSRALTEGPSSVQAELTESERAQLSRQKSTVVHRSSVQAKLAEVQPSDFSRALPYPERAKSQRAKYKLPLLPTTTIGSFPQTEEIRRTRKAYRTGQIDQAQYESFIDTTILDAIRRQEELGIDVLVHGESERNDMVEYFATQLHGFAETAEGWVQSYGTRCVKPPLIYGDVERKAPLTVREAIVAQKATERPVKGMLTGPVTMLKWAFPRDDQSLEKTTQQLALALREEILDLETAGITIIQVDEPAFREGLPLRRSNWDAYLKWAAACFRLATSGVQTTTQIHTHMCYSEFGDILDAIVDLDADVISIETSRSRMELLRDFGTQSYPNEIGPGVYDIHSPRLPETEEMVELLRKAIEVIPVERLWVNPDCGLKTRTWEEVTPALQRMVTAARTLRAELS